MATSRGRFNTDLIEDLRAHGGKASGGLFKGRDILILTTSGAKTGAARETPLVFSRDGDRVVIIGSKGGAPTNPHWYHNLRAQPEVTVEVDGKKFQARAHFAEGDDYERLYKHHADITPSFHEYRQRTTRRIPVVVLEPINSK